MAKDTLLVQVLARFGEVRFIEKWLPARRGEYTYGLWEEGGTITINPAAHLVNTIIHEIIHDIRPNASERVVKMLTTQICRKLSDEQFQAIYEEYVKRVEE